MSVHVWCESAHRMHDTGTSAVTAFTLYQRNVTQTHIFVEHRTVHNQTLAHVAGQHHSRSVTHGRNLCVNEFTQQQ